MDVDFAEVHHKGYADHCRSKALEGFVGGGSSLADMEVNIHSRWRRISSRWKVWKWYLPWLPLILLLLASPSTSTLTEGRSRMRGILM